MKKIVVILSAAVFLCNVFLSCTNGNTTNGNPDNKNTTNENTNDDSIYQKIGNVNKIYKAYSAARFFTGQEIKNIFGCQRVLFSGVLVEYNSLDSEIVEYVSALPKANAYMHQGYDGVEYDAEKVYVEFSTYTDIETDTVIAHEVRIFNGNFLDNFDGTSYAKSVLFDPSMTIDVECNKNIYTGERVNYESDYTFNSINYECFKAVNEFPAEFGNFGELSKVFVVVNNEDEIQKSIMNDAQYYIKYYAEYKSFNEKTIQYYNNRKEDKRGIWYAEDFYINDEMKYIQFHYVFENKDDSKAWAQAFISDPKDFPNLNFGVYINTLYFCDSYPDLYEKVKYLAPFEYKEVTDYPSALAEYGTLEKVYAFVSSDGTIEVVPLGETWSQKTYIAEYTDFTPETKDFIREASKAGIQYGSGHYYLHKDGKKYLEYIEDYQSTKTINGNFYDSDITEYTVGAQLSRD